MARGRTAVFKAADPDAKTNGEFSTQIPFPGTCSICPQALGVSRTASAYNIHQCKVNTNTHWESTSVSYDRSNGGFPSWWQNEIDDAANTWNNDGGADFSFSHSTSSDHDWTKQTSIGSNQ